MGISLTKEQKSTGTNPVDYSEVLGHFHVGANMPGYLPESDVTCLETLEDAIECMIDNLKQSRDVIEERCTSKTIEDKEKGSECCVWCEEWFNIEAVCVAASDKDMHFRAWVELEAWKTSSETLGNLVHYLHTPPEGAQINHWISVHRDKRDTCLLAADQDW